MVINVTINRHEDKQVAYPFNHCPQHVSDSFMSYACDQTMSKISGQVYVSWY